MRPAGWGIAVALSLLAVPAGEVAAFEPMQGCFIADAACPARPSLRRQNNPGAIATEPGRAYPLLGANQKGAAAHLWIRIPEADPHERWVAVGCGHAVEACNRPPAGPDYVLAATWQPAFCERHQVMPECRSQTSAGFDAAHFALHGLWPEPRSNIYCGVTRELRSVDEAGRWSDLPPVDLSAGTRADLEVVMPGTRSALERHEWLKHGTCAGVTAEAYFIAALALINQLNASPARALVAGRIGERLSADQLRASFVDGFGPGAGERVAISCDAGMISELQIHLRGRISATSRLADLLAAAAPVAADCNGGAVDAAGHGR